jgi:hypothetical protein
VQRELKNPIFKTGSGELGRRNDISVDNDPDHFEVGVPGKWKSEPNLLRKLLPLELGGVRATKFRAQLADLLVILARLG